MARTPQDVTGAELNVLRSLWEHWPQTIRQIAEALAPDDPNAYYATVKKLLERLETKGFVHRKPQGNAYIYQPTVDRDELVGRRLREVSESLCNGTLTPLLTQLAQHQQLTGSQQQTLMTLIDDLAKQESKQLNPGDQT